MLWFLWCNILQPKYESLRLFSCHSNVVCVCVTVSVCVVVSLMPQCMSMGICVCLHSNSCIFPTFVGGTSFLVCHSSFHPLQLFSSNWIYIFIQQFIYDRTAHKPFFSRIFQLPMSYRPYFFFLFNCLEWNQNARDSERWTIEAHAVVLRVQHRKCIFFSLWHTISSCWFALCIVTE